jgi:hypothetical protein
MDWLYSFFIEQLQREGRRVIEAPITFTAILILAYVINHFVSKWRYEGIITTIQEKIAFFQEQLKEKDHAIGNLQQQIKEAPTNIQEQERRKYHQEILSECRKKLNNTEFDKTRFRQTIVYSKIRPFLSSQIIQHIENDQATLIISKGRGAGVDNVCPMILDELTQLEIKWGMI